MNTFMFHVKQLKVNKFIKYIWQLIISISNATLRFNFNQKTDNSTKILQGHVDKAGNDYDVDKMIKEKNDSFKQLNFDEDLPTRNTLSTLAPKQNDIKICDVMNESVSCSPNRTKVNSSTDDILCTVNKTFVNTANN